jgi:flagella basal body P-ring formation protein FlgA
MKRILIILVLMGGLLGQLRAETVLYLKKTVEVTSRDVLLGDLVEDKRLIPTTWASRRVIAAPSAGNVSYHALTAIAYGLARYDDMSDVTLSGEPVISVSRRERRVEKDEFYDPLMAYLKTAESWKDKDLEVKILSIPRNTRIPAGETTYQITRIDQKTSKGYSMAYIAVLVDNLQEVEVPVGIEIQHLTKVWVASRNLERGHILQDGDLRSEMHVVDATANYVSSEVELSGHEVNRPVTAGQLFRRNVVSKPMCAKRGEWVAINAIGQNLHITLRGKAMANGRLGDRIMCVNERSQRQVLVELTSMGNGVLVRL